MEDSLRYERNFSAITREEQVQLQTKRVCIVGCGGLGGFLAEYMARIGVGSLTVVDGDRFDRTNLNRQLLSREDNIGCSKAMEARKRIARINSHIEVTAVDQFLTADNAAVLLTGHDLVLDALDSIPHRLMLQRCCAQLRIPMIHGAVEGWFGQITTVFPGDNSLALLYPGCTEETAPERDSSTLSFAPAFVSAIQASEAVKVLLGRESSLRGRVLFVDLLHNRFDSMPLPTQSADMQGYN